MWNILTEFTLNPNQHRTKLEQKKAKSNQPSTEEYSSLDWDDDPNVLNDSGCSQGSFIPEGFARDPIIVCNISQTSTLNTHRAA